MRHGRSFHRIGFAILLCASAKTAFAQGRDAAAQVLFDDGRRLLAQGNYTEACPKFAESHRMSPNGGTLTNLADCLEKEGKTASAWLRYKELAGRANAAGQAAAEKLALDRAAKLEGSLSRVTIRVSATPTEGLEVRLDGSVLPREEWGVAMPLDPGAHKVDATAPKCKSWSSPIDVPRTSTPIAVNVPALEPETPPPVAATPAPLPKPAEEPNPGGTQRTIGLAVGAVGIVGVAVGTIFGLSAMSKNSDALKQCRDEDHCTPEGVRLSEDVKSAGTLSTVAFVVGGAALVGGAVLFFTAPSRAPETAVRVRPLVGWESAGVAVGGGF